MALGRDPGRRDGDEGDARRLPGAEGRRRRRSARRRRGRRGRRATDGRRDVVGIGMLGSGFIAEFHARRPALRAGRRGGRQLGAGPERREAFAARHGQPADASIDGVCADPAVDLVVVALPEPPPCRRRPGRAPARQGRVCTKPLGRNGDEAAEMLRLVERAGVFHGYLENEVFTPEIVRLREMVEAGRPRAGGDDARAGGPFGAACRAFLGRRDGGRRRVPRHGLPRHRDGPLDRRQGRPRRGVFAWGATLGHADRTTAEDNAIVILRFEDGRTATIEASWTAKGGLEVRNEIYCDARPAHPRPGGRRRSGRSSSGRRATSPRRPTPTPAGSSRSPTSRASSATTRSSATSSRAYRAGRAPRETFEDGYVVNTIIDAAYRSMRSGQWEAVAPRPGSESNMISPRQIPNHRRRRWRGQRSARSGHRTRGVDPADRRPGDQHRRRTSVDGPVQNHEDRRR